MIRSKKIFLFVTILLPSLLNAMEKKPLIDEDTKKTLSFYKNFPLQNLNKYKGTVITAENMSQLAPQQIPTDVEEKIKNKFKNFPAMYETLVKQGGVVSKQGLLWDMFKIKKFLELNGLKSLSRSGNIVVKFPDIKDYFVKISSPASRANSALFAQGCKKYMHLHLYDHNKPKSKTYMTLSRLYHHLKDQESSLIENFVRPESGILNVNPKNPNAYDDCNCVFVEKELKGFEPVKKLIKDKEALDEIINLNALCKIFLKIKLAGYWNLGDNLLYNKDSKNFCFVDTEQPNNTAPNELFGNDIKKYRRNATAGVEGLYLALPKGSKQREWLKYLCENDTDISGSGESYSHLKKHF